MINSPLARAALSAAAVAVLSLPASARGDAAFATALGKPPSGLAVMEQLKTAPQAPPQVQGPTAPADVWRKVFRTVLRKGEFSPAEGGILASYGIVEVAEQAQDYFLKQRVIFLVTPVRDGKLQARAAMFITYEATRIPKTTKVKGESWVFEADGNGRLTAARREVSILTPVAGGEATEVKSPAESMALDAAETKERFTSMLEYWSK